ncbi:hypothetical protein M422DRAFT_780186 [Sphaerobolus stellatus SS14]|uniref:Uncharacterized protein n=1 Tax=Sphaerobolus stellatus (strain SS14) TaxID=990650 RepID=A0A0C9UG45_SPHS4|nr:hypothetical protein M422DRAFT_780186 [Sphaerobolus stellatus SS14]
MTQVATSTSARLNAQSPSSSTQAAQHSTKTTSTTQPGQYDLASAYAYPQVQMSYTCAVYYTPQMQGQSFLPLEPSAIVKMVVLELMRTSNNRIRPSRHWRKIRRDFIQDSYPPRRKDKSLQVSSF